MRNDVLRNSFILQIPKIGFLAAKNKIQPPFGNSAKANQHIPPQTQCYADFHVVFSNQKNVTFLN